MEIFVKEDGDVYRVFFGPNSAGWFHKDKLQDVKDIENVLANVAYKYCEEWAKINKSSYTYRTSSSTSYKDQGIIRDMIDILW